MSSKREGTLDRFAEVFPDKVFSFPINLKILEGKGNNLCEWALYTRNPSQSIIHDASEVDSIQHVGLLYWQSRHMLAGFFLIGCSLQDTDRRTPVY